jgi:hypothetical protein
MYESIERMLHTELWFPHSRKAMLAYKPRQLEGNVIPIPLTHLDSSFFDLFSEKQIPSLSRWYATRVAAHFFNPKK